MKKVLTMSLALLLLALGWTTPSQAKTVYIQPNAWAADNAVISLWVWADGSDGSWATLTSVDYGIYKAELGDAINRMIITRGSAGYTWESNNGKGLWNKTGTIEIADGNVGKLFALSTTQVVQSTTEVTISDYTEPQVVANGVVAFFVDPNLLYHKQQLNILFLKNHFPLNILHLSY